MTRRTPLTLFMGLVLAVSSAFGQLGQPQVPSESLLPEVKPIPANVGGKLTEAPKNILAQFEEENTFKPQIRQTAAQELVPPTNNTLPSKPIPPILSGQPAGQSVLVKSEPVPVNQFRPTEQATGNAVIQNPTLRQPSIPEVPAVEPAMIVESQPELQPLRQPAETTPADTTGNKLGLKSYSPQVSVSTEGPKTIKVGKTSIYRVKVDNVGANPSGGVMVAVTIPSHIQLIGSNVSAGTPQSESNEAQTRIVWSIASVASRSNEMLELKVTPKQSAPFDINIEWTFVPLTESARVIVTEPKLAMEISGPSDVKYGEKAIYTITVSNPGTGDAEDVIVMLSDSLGGEQASVGTIPAGDRRQFEVELIARDAGELDLGATVKADGNLSVDSAKKIVVRRAKLEVVTAAPRFKYAGSEVTYEVVVSNVGDAVASNVFAAIALPLGAEYLGGIQGASEAESGQGLRWQIGTLTSGSERRYKFRCKLNTAGTARLEAGARGEEDLAAAHVATTKVEALADLTLKVNDPRGPQQVGDEVSYEIVLKNVGTKEATNVQLIGQFSPGIEPTRADGLPSQLVPGQVIFQSIPRLKVGQEIKLKVLAKASQNGTHTFRAELKCEDQDIRRVSEGTTKYFNTEELLGTEKVAEQPSAPADFGGFRK